MQSLDNQQQSFSSPQQQPSINPQQSTVAIPFTTFCGLAVLQQVTPERFQRAVNSLADGSLAVTITSQSETAIKALARNGEGQDYRLSLNAAGTTCNCADALFRHSICKHAIALALQLLLVPQQPDPQQQPAVQEPEPPVNLRLGKVRRHWSYPA